jgi:hypothetical protein
MANGKNGEEKDLKRITRERRERDHKRAAEFESKDSPEVQELKKKLAFAEHNWHEYKGLLHGTLIALEDAKKVIEDGQKSIAELESRSEPKPRVGKKKGR